MKNNIAIILVNMCFPFVLNFWRAFGVFTLSLVFSANLAHAEIFADPVGAKKVGFTSLVCAESLAKTTLASSTKPSPLFLTHSVEDFFPKFWQRKFMAHLKKIDRDYPGAIISDNLWLIDDGSHVQSAADAHISNTGYSLRRIFYFTEYLLMPIYDYAAALLEKLNRNLKEEQGKDHSSKWTIDVLRVTVADPAFGFVEQQDDDYHLDPYYSVVANVGGEGLHMLIPQEGSGFTPERIRSMAKYREIRNLRDDDPRFTHYQLNSGFGIEFNGLDRSGTVPLIHRADDGSEKRRFSIIIFFRPLREGEQSLYQINSNLRGSGLYPGGDYRHEGRALD